MNPFGIREGISFVEIVIAVTVSAIFFAGLMTLTSTTRIETRKAGNYLRALQLAQESIELVQSTPPAKLMQNSMQLFEGSLVDPQTGQSIAIPHHQDSAWALQTTHYPKQYNKAFFYRKLRIEEIDASIPNARFMRKVIAEIYWNESLVPEKIETVGSEPDRMRKLALATLIFVESEPY
jgi:type II secretory pathway pseudopilin PulG